MMKPAPKSIIHNVLATLAILAVVGLVTARLLSANELPANALTMATSNNGRTNKGLNTVFLTLSNASDTTIVFEMNGGIPMFLIALEIDERWTNMSSRAVGRGPFLLAPHVILTTQIDLPSGVRRAKVELPVTPLSPRTRLLFRLQQMVHWRWVRRLTQWSFALDQRKEREMSFDITPIHSSPVEQSRK